MFTDYGANNYDRPYRYWAPLIALYTGARIAEISGLRTSDIYDVNGCRVIDINTNSDDKRLKTDNSYRTIPIHKKLVEFGLIEYFKYLKKDNQERLFPELNHSIKHGYSRQVSEWFNQYLKKLSVHSPRKKVFHSFRHTFATELSHLNVPDICIEQLSGRSIGQNNTGRAVYIKEYDINNQKDCIFLSEQIDKLNYNDCLINVKRFNHNFLRH